MTSVVKLKAMKHDCFKDFKLETHSLPRRQLEVIYEKIDLW